MSEFSLPGASRRITSVLRAAIAICMIAMLGGCISATGTALEPQSKPRDPRHARLYFFRPLGFVSMTVAPEVRINEVAVGTVANGSYFFVDRPPGQYAITVEAQPDIGIYEADLQVTAGGTYYYEIAVMPTYIPFGGGHFVKLDQGHGGSLIRGRGLNFGTYRLSAWDAASGATAISGLHGR